MKSSDPIVDQLVSLDSLKTWSLIATLFGDLRGDELSGTQIRELFAGIGIKPEALRVALHRLKSDGWIEATKQGRMAIYHMSPSARAETQAVAPDIYRQTVKFPLGWVFELTPEAAQSTGGISLGRSLSIVPVTETRSKGDSLLLAPQHTDLPSWLAEHLVSARLIDLADGLDGLLRQIEGRAVLQDQTLVRLLVLHQWRRIALRSGSWAHAYFYPEGAIARCHKRVTGFLQATDRIALDP